MIDPLATFTAREFSVLSLAMNSYLATKPGLPGVTDEDMGVLYSKINALMNYGTEVAKNERRIETYTLYPDNPKPRLSQSDAIAAEWPS